MKRLFSPLRRLASLLAAGSMLLATAGASEAQLSSASPWPMLGGDLRHTGQADVLGPKFAGSAPAANQVRSLTFYDKIKMFPSVGGTGTVYVGMGWQFCAINPLDVTNVNDPVLTQKWCVPTIADVSASAAAVDQDEYVYFGDRDNSVYKLRGSDGARMWVYNNGHEGDVHASPAIGPDGTIYFAFSQNYDGNGSITAIKNTGASTYQIKWKLAVGQFATNSSPVLVTDPNDGKPIIILGFADSKVRAIKDNGTSAVVLWKTATGIGSIIASPVVGPDGTVYVGGSNGMYALDPITGALKWTYSTLPGKVDATAAIGSNGILYFVSRNGNQRTVHAINPAVITPQNPAAGLVWTYGPVVASLSPAGGFPIIGADGIIYVTMANGVYALNPNTGALLWNHNSTGGIISAPAMGIPKAPTPPATTTTSGTAVLYYGSQDRKVYAITSPRVGLTQNDPPVPHLQISPGQSVPAGTEVTFDASTSTDPNGDQLFYTWDLGDGTFASGEVVEHTYWTAGTYPITLIVSDGVANTTYLPKPNITVTGGGLTFFCDAFTRGNSTTIGSPGASGLPSPCPATNAQQWGELSGSWSISGSQLVTDPIKAIHTATVGGLAGADQVVATDFISPLNSTAPKFGIILRFIDPQNYYIAYRLVGGASVLRIAKVVGGVETVLKQVPVPNPTLNVPFRLRAVAAGSNLSLQLDGGTIATITDTTYTGGGIGLTVSWATTATPSYKVDNFKACVGGPGAACSGIQ